MCLNALLNQSPHGGAARLAPPREGLRKGAHPHRPAPSGARGRRVEGRTSGSKVERQISMHRLFTPSARDALSKSPRVDLVTRDYQACQEALVPFASLSAISGTFNSLFRVLFTFPSWYLFASNPPPLPPRTRPSSRSSSSWSRGRPRSICTYIYIYMY